MMTMQRLPRYQAMPPVVTGHPLGNDFSVILPVERTNLITNPSFETNTTSWTAVGGSIARSAAEQYHGAYGLAITPSAGTNSDGAYYGTVSLVSGTTYAYSCKVKGTAGRQYTLSIATTGGSNLTAVTFTATGRWQWISGYYTETSSTTRRVYLRKNSHSSAAVFYLDGVQVEAITTGETASTYLDGDQIGLVPNQFPPAYRWNGTPHASTSTRSGQTRAGGMVMRLDKYGFLLLAIIGLGFGDITPIAQSYAQLDGAQYIRSIKPPRSFSLAGRISAATYPQLQRQTAGLSAALDRDRVGQDQPLTLLYQARDDCDRPTSDTARLVAICTGGPGDTVDNLHATTATLSFTMYAPLVMADAEQGAALGVQQSITNANNILQRSLIGGWSALGTGVNGAVNGAVRANDGSVYVAGAFTTASGTTVNGVAKWTPATNTWSALGATPGVSGGTATGYGLAIAPNGDLYLGGNFTAAGGVAAANIAKWNGSAWSALGTGANNTVGSLVFGPDGSLYLGGSFTAAGGVANTRGIAKWDGASYSALGTGADTTVVQALVFGLDGGLYAGGSFTGMGGVANTARIAKWSGSAWSALGAGMGNSVGALAVAPDGSIYAGGAFTTAGGVSASRIARWNGTSWQPLGSGVDGAVYALAFTPDGALWVGGDFTTAGGITLADRLARWTGAAWVPADIDLPGTPLVQTLALAPDGTLYLGSSTTGTAAAAAVTTITNTGTVQSYPTIAIQGPAPGVARRVYQIANLTTGRNIYLSGSINAGETWTLCFDPANLSFVSDFQGNIQRLIVPGSNEADFFLQTGVNAIAVFTADSSMTATIRWRPGYVAVQDLTP